MQCLSFHYLIKCILLKLLFRNKHILLSENIKICWKPIPQYNYDRLHTIHATPLQIEIKYFALHNLWWDQVINCRIHSANLYSYALPNEILRRNGFNVLQFAKSQKSIVSRLQYLTFKTNRRALLVSLRNAHTQLHYGHKS